jgi:hypothetical protein
MENQDFSRFFKIFAEKTTGISLDRPAFSAILDDVTLPSRNTIGNKLQTLDDISPPGKIPESPGGFPGFLIPAVSKG